MIDVLYFAWVRERIGLPRERLETTAPTVRALIAELVARGRLVLGPSAPVILTGGWSRAILPAVPGATEMPDLVLLGIALAAERCLAR